MAKRIDAGEKSGTVSFNVVPLVDVIMLLIFFFVLTTEIASKSIASMDLPQPHDSVAQGAKSGVKPNETGNKIIVNVVSAALPGTRADAVSQKKATEGHLMIEGEDISIIDSDALVRRIRQAVAAAGSNPDFKKEDFAVEVRADKDVYWQYVAPVMAAASACGVRNVTLTALTDAAAVPKQEGAK
jgi:biopolymer transport protein ExbD